MICEGLLTIVGTLGYGQETPWRQREFSLIGATALPRVKGNLVVENICTGTSLSDLWLIWALRIQTKGNWRQFEEVRIYVSSNPNFRSIIRAQPRSWQVVTQHACFTREAQEVIETLTLPFSPHEGFLLQHHA